MRISLYSVLLFFCLAYSSSLFAELRDPTRPENVPGFHASSLDQGFELEAIIISKWQKTAIFHGRSVHEGDELFGFKVESIQPNTVHLAGPDGKMTLFLFNQNMKQLVR